MVKKLRRTIRAHSISGYGTTVFRGHERILLGFQINGKPMGSDFVVAKGGLLRFNLEVHGTDNLAEVSVFACPFIEGDNTVAVGQSRFRQDDPLVDKARNSWTVAFEKHGIDSADFSESWTQRYRGKPMVYYVRIRQKNSIALPSPLEGFPTVQKRPVCAWSSPIWIRSAD